MHLQLKNMARATACATAIGLIAGAATAQEPQRGGTAIIHMVSEQRVLNPGLRASTGVYNISGKIIEPLIDLTYDGYVPVLATDWSSSEDGLTITVNLREGVNWHDGEPFTCADVSFSAMEMWKELLNYSSTLQRNLESVDCPDTHTAVFNYSSPMPLDLFVAAMPDLGHPLPRHLYEGTDILRNELNAAPIGTGPFRFVEYRPDSHVRLTRFDDYTPNTNFRERDGFGGRKTAHFDAITIRFMPEGGARTAGLQTGELHVLEALAVPAAQRLRADRNIRTHEMIPWAYQTLMMNHAQGPTNNVAFRRAVQAKPDEEIVFSWVQWPDRAARDAGNQKIMNDPRLADKEIPFDGRRLIFGGFEPVVTL